MRCCPPAWVLGEILTSSQLNNCHIYKPTHVSRTALIILYKMRKGEKTCDWALAM